MIIPRPLLVIGVREKLDDTFFALISLIENDTANADALCPDDEWEEHNEALGVQRYSETVMKALRQVDARLTELEQNT